MTYLTVAEFKMEQDIAGSSDDAVIADCLNEAQSFIDSHCNRTFEGNNNSSRTFDAVEDVEGSVLWVYGAGDLASIDSVINGDGNAVSSSVYTTQPRNAVAKGKPIIGIKLISSSVYWQGISSGVSEDAITVNGVWAYSKNAPADIARAAKMLTSYYYDHRKSIGSDIAVIPGVSVKIPTGIPSAVRQILANYVRESF
jgi:hypothetical protein